MATTIPCPAKDCIDGKWKGKSRYNCFTCSGTGQATDKVPSHLRPLLEKIKNNLSKIPASKRSFAESLCNQLEKKGSLSMKQMPYFNQFHELAQKPAYVAPPPPATVMDGGWDAVVELIQGAHDNGLKVIKLRVDGFSIKSDIRPNRRKGGEVAPIWVDSYRGGPLDRSSFVATLKEGHPDFTEFKIDPIGVMTQRGLKTGNCCFCGRHLNDPRSTAHGYGPVCAKNYGLTWNTKSATVIEEKISDRVHKVVLDITDEGSYRVIDSETDEVIATFTSRRDAVAFCDEFSTWEEVQ
jgi:hypothetical protein